jgi:hypothetical protein
MGPAVGIDSTTLKAKGGVWHKRDREAGVVPLQKGFTRMLSHIILFLRANFPFSFNPAKEKINGRGRYFNFGKSKKGE